MRPLLKAATYFLTCVAAARCVQQWDLSKFQVVQWPARAWRANCANKAMLTKGQNENTVTLRGTTAGISEWLTCLHWMRMFLGFPTVSEKEYLTGPTHSNSCRQGKSKLSSYLCKHNKHTYMCWQLCMMRPAMYVQ